MSTSADLPVPDYVAELDKPIKGLKIGVAKEYFGEGLDAEVRSAIEAAIQKLANWAARSSKCRCRTRSMRSPLITLSRPQRPPRTWRGLMACATGFARKDVRSLSEMYRRTRDQGFGAEVKRRIMLGTYALSAGYYDAYYLKAQRVRTLLTRDFDDAFKKVDAIVTPTSPTAAFKLGEKVDDPLAMYLADIYTVTADLAGIPGISIPSARPKKSFRLACRFSASTSLRARFCGWRTRTKRRLNESNSPCLSSIQHSAPSIEHLGTLNAPISGVAEC